jgi:hypothetical protein
MTSLPRLFEELQLAIGGAFQEALQAKVTFLTNKLKDMIKWLKENEEQVKQFGHLLGSLATALFKLFDMAIKTVVSLPGKIQGAGVAIARFLNDTFDLISEEQLEENVNNLGRTAKQAIAIIVTVAATGVSAIVNSLGWLVDSFKAFVSFVKGDTTWNDFGREIDESWERHMTNIENNAASAFFGASDALGLIPKAAEEAEEAVDDYSKAVEDAVDDSEALAAALKEVEKAFQDLQEEVEEELELDVIKRAREQVERELQESFRREDIERNFQDRLDKIKEQGGDKSLKNFERWQEQRQQAAKDHSKRLVDIERSYQQNLKDLQEDFEADANELARKRDAVGLLALERRHKRNLGEAKKARDREKEDAQRSYDEQLEKLKESYEKFEDQITESIEDQIDAAEKAREKEYESFERSLDRQRQLRELHATWEEEDRQRELQKKLDDLGESFADIEGITADGLSGVLGEWEGFFGDLSGLYQSFIAEQQYLNSLIAANAPSPLGLGSPLGLPNDPTAPGFLNNPYYNRGSGRGRGGESTGSENFGQMGQVSSMLAGMFNSIRVPDVAMAGGSLPQRLESAPPQTTKKEIHVTADLTGIDPHMQQVVINTMMEIERNKGG